MTSNSSVTVGVEVHPYEARGLNPLSGMSRAGCDICALPRRHSVHSDAYGQGGRVAVAMDVHRYVGRGLDPLSLRYQTGCEECRLPKAHIVHGAGR